MINSIIRGLFEWLYGLFLNLIEYCANSLLGLMSTDLTFFEQSVPAVSSLFSIFVAVGWALLIGNCIFQAMKSMLSGLGFEAESPVQLFARTFVYGFILVFSRQVCEIGLGIAGKVIELVEIPTDVKLTTPDSSFFTGAGDASWILVIITGVILGVQLIKLFFEIGERYVVVVILTLTAPLGFSMGGSKATKEICVGYIRMYASMLVMMVMNVLFMKLALSALLTMPKGALVLPWCVLVVAIVKVARKVDEIISRIGLNPAITGDPLGRGGRMMTVVAARTIMSSVSKNRASHSAGGNSSTAKTGRNSSFSKSGNASKSSKSTGSGYKGKASNTSSVNTKNSGSTNTYSGNNGTKNQNSQNSGQVINSKQNSGQSTQQAGGQTVNNKQSQSSQNSHSGQGGNSLKNSSTNISNAKNRFGAAGANKTKAGVSGTTSKNSKPNTGLAEKKSGNSQNRTNQNKKLSGPGKQTGVTPSRNQSVKQGNSNGAKKNGIVYQNKKSMTARQVRSPMNTGKTETINPGKSGSTTEMQENTAYVETKDTVGENTKLNGGDINE